MKKYALLAIFVFISLALLFLLIDSSPEDIIDNPERIDPVPHAKELVNNDKYSEADEYLSYFMVFPYVSNDYEAQELLKEIKDKRSSWSYRMEKGAKGFISGESDEGIGKTTAIISDFLVIGDVRDLANEGTNYFQDKEVDNVTVALSTIGVAATLATAASIFSSNSSNSSNSNLTGEAVKVKAGLSILKVLHKAKLMPKWLRDQLVDEPKTIQKTLNSIYELQDNVGFESTVAIVNKSKNLEHLNELKNLANVFGDKTGMLLKLADEEAILAYKKYGKTAQKDILNASVYGEKGVSFLNNKGVDKFRKFDNDYQQKQVRRITNLEKDISDSGVKVLILGKSFIKRSQIFDHKYIDATGATNVERMRRGLAPIGSDGQSVHLHHMKQQRNGNIAELTATEHRVNSSVLHRYTNESEIDRNEFNILKTKYWKERAKDFD